MFFVKYFQVFLISCFLFLFIILYDIYDEGFGLKEDGVFEEFLFEVGIVLKEDGEYFMVFQNVFYLFR